MGTTSSRAASQQLPKALPPSNRDRSVYRFAHTGQRHGRGVRDGRSELLRQRVAVAQYTPTKVRSTVADYGASDKEQIREMVGLLLNRSLSDIALDASDALAVAICHATRSPLPRAASARITKVATRA